MTQSPAILFHGFHSSEHLATPGSISQEDFRYMLKTVSEHKAIVGPEDFFDLVNQGGKNMRGGSDVCILTLDDSLRY